MNGSKILVDTNIFITLSEGKIDLSNYLDGNDIYFSVITEIELFGYTKITKKDKEYFKLVLSFCYPFDLISQIKEITINLKQKYSIKLPDAIIASTAIFLGIPLLTFDKGFEEIEELTSIILENKF